MAKLIINVAHGLEAKKIFHPRSLKTALALKIRILLAYTGQLIVSRQATFLSGHKITVLILLVCFSTGQSALDIQKVI